MKIEFVNHASTILSYDGINIITDPWIEGKVFHNGWSLITKTKFSLNDYKRITHIWFSHEHPDHFYPPNISSIPEEFRKNITVLYHYTNDKKVINFCKKLSFKEIIELQPNVEFTLTKKIKLISTPHGHDSWLYIKTDKYSLLNTNDCIINSKNDAQKIFKVVGEIDILLTQFSYARKYGNGNQTHKRERAIKRKLTQMQIQMEVFKPDYFMPIASFIWFSHEENFYMNDRMNTVDKVSDFVLENNVKPIILYPGSVFEIGSIHNNEININKYMIAYNKINIDNTDKTNSVGLEKLTLSATKYIDKLKNDSFLAFILLSIFPIKCYLRDLDKTVKFSVLKGLKKTDKKDRSLNFELSSEVLDYCLNFYWGFETTKVNGRFDTARDRDFLLFSYYSFINSSINHQASTNTIINKVKHLIMK